MAHLAHDEGEAKLFSSGTQERNIFLIEATQHEASTREHDSTVAGHILQQDIAGDIR